jgi:hypothetical protein
MGTISFTKDDDYSSRKAAIARQEKLAEMLSQMGAQEQAISTAGGITAPISGMGALARGLTSFGGSYMSGKAAADAAALDKASRAEAAAAGKALYTMPGTKGQLRISDEEPGVTATPMEMNMPTLPGQEPSGEKVQYTLNMPNIPGREMGGGARSYEDQQRMLDELDLSGNPYMAKMATGARARIEAERDRDQPKMTAVGANGMVDSNPRSPTYGQTFAVPPADADKTTDITNYKFAVLGGEKRPFPAWLAAQSEGKRSSTTVNVGPTGVNYGEPGEGLVWQRGPNNSIALDARGAPIAIPYQGGKAYLTDEQKKTAAAQEKTNQNLATKIVTDELNRARNIIKTSEIPVTGIAGAIGTRVPGSQARDLKGQLQTIKARIGFDELNRMRKSSPTGGALGQIAVQELGYLQSVYGDLEQSQSEKAVLYNLDRLENEVYRLVNEDLKKPRTAERPPLSSFGGRKP